MAGEGLMRIHRFGVLAAGLAAVALAGGPGRRAGGATRAVTSADLLRMRMPYNVALSPDGKTVAFAVFEPGDPVSGAPPPPNCVWVVPTNGTRPAARLTAGPMDWSPKWSPDGRSIAFLSARSGPPRVYVTAALGSRAKPITPPGLEALDFNWSPDGEKIAFLLEDETRHDYGEYRDVARDENVVSRNPKPVRLFAADLRTGTIRGITEPDRSVLQYDWSPDSQSFAVLARTASGIEAFPVSPADGVDLLAAPLAGGPARRLASIPGALGAVRWAPGGSRIAVLGRDAAGASKVMRTIYIVSALDGAPRVENVLGDYAGSVDSIEWLNDLEILFNGLEGFYASPRLLRLKDRSIAPVFQERGVIGGLAVSRSRSRLAFTLQSAQAPAEIYTGTLDGRVRKLTDLNPEARRLKFGRSEILHWRAGDGRDVEGRLLTPPDFRAGIRYPTVVMPPGGATGWSGWKAGFLTDVGPVLAVNGYAVLYVNSRGTPGYGREFESALVGDVGGRELQDILDGIDRLIADGITDPGRLGIGGWSWGGTLAAWAVTQTDRFRCAVDGGGVVDWTGFFGQSDAPFIAAIDFTGTPRERGPLYAERSALSHVDRVTTPILILHGAQDPRVPPGQAWEFYRGLKALGKEAEMVLYPEEKHFLLEPRHALNFMVRVERWYDERLKAPVRASAGPAARTPGPALATR